MYIYINSLLTTFDDLNCMMYNIKINEYEKKETSL